MPHCISRKFKGKKEEGKEGKGPDVNNFFVEEGQSKNVTRFGEKGKGEGRIFAGLTIFVAEGNANKKRGKRRRKNR